MILRAGYFMGKVSSWSMWKNFFVHLTLSTELIWNCHRLIVQGIMHGFVAA
jgi:hypothetical protein